MENEELLNMDNLEELIENVENGSFNEDDVEFIPGCDICGHDLIAGDTQYFIDGIQVCEQCLGDIHEIIESRDDE